MELIVRGLVGGLLVGAGVSLIFITAGIRAGASGFYTAMLSYVSRHSYFRGFKGQRTWRLIFAMGLLSGGLAVAFFSGPFVTQVSWSRLAIGGFLVGFGARVSRGCTSGHGICGLASRSLASFFAVLTFLSVAIITALVVRTLGVLP